MPTATRVLAWIGEPIDAPFLKNYERTYGADLLSALLSESIVGRRFWRLLQLATSRKRRELFELLALEDYLCQRPAAVSSSFPPNVHLDKTLHTLRQNIALSLYERARDLSAHYPLTSVRVLQVAQQYLSVVCAHDHLSRRESLSSFSGRLAVAVFLEARFTSVPEDRLRSAVQLLQQSISQGNDATSAKAYMAEGLMRIADATASREPLLEALRVTGDVESAQARLVESQCWIRLAQHAETEAGRSSFLDKAEHAIGLPAPRSHIASINAMLLAGIIQQSRTARFQPRGLSLPFGLRRHLRVWLRADPRRATTFVDQLIERYETDYPQLCDSRIGSRIVASLLSVRAEVGHLSSARRRELLERAVSLRGGLAGATRGGPESQLETAVDSIRLYDLSAPPIRLVQGLQTLLELSVSDEQWPLPVLVLAQTIDRHWPMPPAVQYQLLQQVPAADGELITAVRSGDARRLYRLAAMRALSSPEVERRTIGGRNGVFQAADYTGLLDEAFVFKPTYRNLAERDARRSSMLAKHCDAHPNWQIGVAETIATIPVRPTPALQATSGPVVAAKRFQAGVLLADSAIANPEDRVALFQTVARFLARIQAWESVVMTEESANVRRELWKKEFGFWLRSGLRCDDATAIFADWWSTVEDLVQLPRRDAHALNWIVGDSGRLIAVDFEAVGLRPVGYELAQLTDDIPLLGDPAESWGIRKSILRTYRDTLERTGLVVSSRDVMRGYRAGLVARAVRLLTNTEGTELHRAHGAALIDWIARESPEPGLRRVAAAVKEAWRIRRTASGARTISDARRRHLSRAMAFHLRHGDDVFVDAHGWAYLASVSDRLRKDGLATNKEELRLVAEAIDETRFEVVQGKVRAAYGHSRDVSIERDHTTSGTVLFHGTATGNLGAILERGEGLRPMARRWVHLSADVTDAERAARRHGGYTLLRVTVGDETAFFHASGATHLCERVDASAIEIVSPASFLFASGMPLEPLPIAGSRPPV